MTVVVPSLQLANQRLGKFIYIYNFFKKKGICISKRTLLQFIVQRHENIK